MEYRFWEEIILILDIIFVSLIFIEEENKEGYLYYYVYRYNLFFY